MLVPSWLRQPPAGGAPAPAPASGRTGDDDGALPHDLVLVPLSRRPLVLPASTVRRVMTRPVRPWGTAVCDPAASIVVVAHDNLVFTRMCVDSVLANTGRGPFEVVVVDNASTDCTRPYLQRLQSRDRRVRTVLNDANVGFAAGVNAGLAAARGEVLVVLNNDVVVPPNWLDGLAHHLGDEEVGMVGPVTNSAPNEARVPTSYATYGEFVAEAGRRSRQLGGHAFDITVLTMFCVALRRAVLGAVGPLDEQFGMGMFEDDDYAARVAGAGYRVLCADGLLVHHFGEASFGHLVPTGEHAALMAENRHRFERKWGRPWRPHAGRRFPGYLEMVARVQALVHEYVPAGASVVVVSKGDDELVRLGERRAIHFPSDGDGRFAGHYPGDSAAAVSELERHRRSGATFVVLPQTSFWWLDHYPGLAQHLEGHYSGVAADPACRIYRYEGRVASPAGEGAAPTATGPASGT